MPAFVGATATAVHRKHIVLMRLVKVHLPGEATATARGTKSCTRTIDFGLVPISYLGRLGVDDLQLLAAISTVDEQTSITALRNDSR